MNLKTIREFMYVANNDVLGNLTLPLLRSVRKYVIIHDNADVNAAKNILASIA